MFWGKKNKTVKKSTGEDESDNEEDEKGEVKTKRNHIYFYGPVNRKNALALNESINELNEPGNQYSEIWLHINSYGGTVYDALSSVDTIIGSRTPIVTIIEGMAASSATLLVILSDRRLIRPNSVMLIHQLRGGVYGRQSDVEDEMKNIHNLHSRIEKLFKKNTKLNSVKLKKMFCRELEYSSQECLDFGFVDEIYVREKTLGKRKRSA